jgi:hypothetical protein
MAFTLAKNATKPNPFEIIPLQTTRKENNWKTEEALTRAAVTGDGTGQRVQSLMFMMMIYILYYTFSFLSNCSLCPTYEMLGNTTCIVQCVVFGRWRN